MAVIDGTTDWKCLIVFLPNIIVFLFFLANFLDLFKHDTTCMKGFPLEWPSLGKPATNNLKGHFYGYRSCKPDEALLLKIFQVVSNPIPEAPSGQNKPGWNL